jgi:glycosyltransferase involved in cell wall biosynthesis
VPQLSIITVNLNNAPGLQKTLDSVFAQTFTDVEYIVIDGGSADGSKQILENNTSKFSYWVSEKDTGIYNAMNNGITHAKGEYLLFLNSGDKFISSGILQEVAGELDGKDLIYGDIFLVESDTRKWTGHYPDQLTFQHFMDGSLPHPSTFIKRSLFEQLGLFDDSLQITADWKFFLDAVCKYNVSYKHINKVISIFDHNGLSSQTTGQAIISSEKKRILENNYQAYVADINELKKLRIIQNQPLLRLFIKVSKMFGRLKEM